MAIEKVIEIKVKDKQAVKAFDNIDNSIDRTKKSVIALEAQLLKLDRAEKRLHRNDSKRRKKINDLRDKTNQSLKIQKNRLKSLSLQKQIANKATKKQIKSNKSLNKEYFKSKESLTDVNRLTAEFALKVKAVQNIFIGAVKSVKAFAKAQKLAFTAGVIGIAIIALALIVTHWQEIKDLVQGISRELRLQIKLNNLLLDRSKSRLTILQEEEKLLVKKGLSTKQNLEDQRKEIIKQNELNAANLIDLKILLEKNFQSAIRLSLLDRLFGRTAQITKSELEGLTATREQIEAIEVAIAKGENTIFDFDNPKVGKGEKGVKRDKTSVIDFSSKDTSDKALNLLKKFGDAEFKLIQSQNKAKIDAEIELLRQKAVLSNEDLRRQEELQKASIEIATLEAEGKIELAFLVADALASVGDLIGKETALGKALAVSSALISTFLSANLAYQSQFLPIPTVTSPIRAAIAAGVAVAAGLANVKAILAVKTPGGASGAIPSAGQQQAPSFNVVGTSGTNQLAQSLSQQDQPIQAFVVGSNVTSQQALDRNIINTATIG